MKFFSLILLSVILISCQSNSSNKAQYSIRDFTDDSTIIGSWALCAEKCDLTIYQFNTCSSLYFKSDGTGGYAKNSPFVEKFKWTFKKGVLKFYNDPKNISNTFIDSTYFAILNNRDSAVDLTINQIKQDFSYLLSREISN